MDKKIHVAINGAGRIGRAFVRLAQNVPNIEIVALNDLGDIDNIAYLLKYDTAYGAAQFPVEVKA
ncbi:MAG: glyceraldehyde 3-phosphate dehydrogenase NAD-binding domain-containing protein, partial [Candidatus Zambryskibacteria bacterium]